MKSVPDALRAASVDDSQANDPVFERLVEQVTAQLHDSGQIDLERLAAEHPQYADQLRDLLPAIEMLAHIANAPATPPATNGDAPHAPQHQLGDFRILRELGRGGMGVVYEAEQISLSRRVALKVLPFAGMLDQQQLARFKNEARAAATLHHEHIVPIHAVGSDRGVHFYAMQLVEGQSLAQVVEQMRRDHDAERLVLDVRSNETSKIRRQQASNIQDPASRIGTAALAARSTLPNFSSKEYYSSVAKLGIQAAAALDHAHQNGILHRDIKPANLLMDNAGKLWVTDFGLARMEADASMTMTGDLLGTLRYMSPEQALARRVLVDHRSDIYSLGVTLYELLTLQPVFGETDRSELLKQIAFEEPRSPRQIDSRIPVELETIVLKAMRKSPEERYVSAGELADDLQSFLEHKPIKAKPPTWREQVVKWIRRHPAAIWAAVMFLLATTAVSAFSAALIASAYNSEAAQRKLAEAERQIAQEERHRAESERKRAENNFDRAKKLIGAVLVPGAWGRGEWSELSSSTREKMADLADNYYQGLLNDGSSDPSLQYETAVGYSSLALLHWSRGSFSQAETAARKSLAISHRLCVDYPEASKYRQHLAYSNWMLCLALDRVGKVVEAEAAIDTAIGVYKELISNKPWKEDLYSELWSSFGARDDLRQKQGDSSRAWVDEAITFYRNLLQQTPDIAVAHADLGKSLHIKELTDEAIAEFQEAIRLDPTTEGVRSLLGQLLYAKGSPDEAVAVLREAVRPKPPSSEPDENIDAISNDLKNPNNPTPHTNLGVALLASGELDEAINALRTSLTLDRNDALIHHNLGCALAINGELDEALAAFRQVVRLVPEHDKSLPYRYVGLTCLQMGLLDEAIANCREALRLEPRTAEFHKMLAYALYYADLQDEATSEFEKAIAGCRDSIRGNPNNSFMMLKVAPILASCPVTSLRNPPEAVELATRAVELDPTAQNGLTTLGIAYYRAGNFNRAVEALQKAYELDKNDPECLFSLAMAEWHLGNHDAAREWYANGIDWLKQRPQIVDGDSHYFRAEAAELLGAEAEELRGAEAEKLLGIATAGTSEAAAASEKHSNDQRQPEERKAFGNLELRHEESKRIFDSDQIYRAAIQSAPQNVKAHIYRATIQSSPQKNAKAHRVLGYVLAAKGKFVEAEEVYRRALSLDSKEPSIYVALAQMLYDQKRHADAKAALNEGSKLAAGNSALHQQIGDLFREHEEFAAAEQEYRKAYQADPKLFPAYKALAELLLEQEKAAEASEVLEEMFRVEPQNADLRYEGGELLKKHGELAAAETAFRKAVRLRPDVTTIAQLGWTLQQAGKTDEAQTFLKKAFDLRPRDFETERDWADDIAKAEKFYEAAELYKRLVHEKPDDSRIAIREAFLFYLRGDRDEYEACCRRMLDRWANTKEPTKARHTMWACSLSPQVVGDKKHLLPLADLTLTDKTNSHLALRERGFFAYRMGDWENALKWCAESRAKDTRTGNQVSPRINLLIESMASHHLGKASEALKIFKDANMGAPESIPNEDWIEWQQYVLVRDEARKLLDVE